MEFATAIETTLPGLYASAPEGLSFAPSFHMRAFGLARDEGNVLIYSSPTADAEAFAAMGGLSRAYLGHWHEVDLGVEVPGVPLFVHEGDREETERKRSIRATFTERHTLGDDLEVIPIPGHTPGSTAYLWDSGEHRFLFTADSLYFDGGEWVAAVLDSSDRERYLESLELIRELDFDVLVPWIATAGDPYYAVTSNRDARRRLDAIIARVRRGENR